MADLIEGPHGRAELVPPGEGPEWAETVCTWLLTAPWAHPLWSQYMLAVVRLRDGVPGFPPPKRQFDGATHELIVVALNPEHGPFTVASVERFQRTGMPYLTPLNIAHQIEGSDEEAAELAELAALAVVRAWLCPETADAPERVRANWKASLVRTLAHIRGEAHAS